MKKKFTIALALLIAAAALLTGCSGAPAQESAAQSESAAPAQSAETGNQTSSEASPAESSSADESSGSYKIGVTLMDYNYAHFQNMLAAIKMEAANLGDIEIVDFDARQDVTKQINDMSDMISALKVDAIILNPVDSEALGSAVIEANNAGIPVVTADINVTEGDVYTFVASDNVEIGRLNGQYCVELLKEKYGEPKGSIYVSSWTKSLTMREREQGFREIVEQYPDITLDVRYPTELSTDGCMRLAEDALTAHAKGELDIAATLNVASTLGFMAAQGTAGRDEIICVGVDEDPDLLAEMEKEDSTLYATVVQFPVDMGVQATDYAIQAIEGAPAETDFHSTEIRLITKENVADFNKEKELTESELAPYK